MENLHSFENPYGPSWRPAAYRAAGALLVTGAVLYAGAGYYLSSQMLNVTRQRMEYDQSVVAFNPDGYTMHGGAYDINGLVGGIRPDGTTVGIFGKPTNLDHQGQTSTRTLLDAKGRPPQVHESLSLQGNVWTTNPKDALGLDYNDVQYSGPLGNMNAWMVPVKDSKVWTIGVHGVGAPLSELLRFMPSFHEAGNNFLAMGYRNDEGNPASPDGYNHLGGTEWQDLRAAVQYAKGHGAEVVNLFGVSIGGSIVENYLRKAPADEVARIGKIVLQSPVLDWNGLVDHRLKSGGYPSILAYPGKGMAWLRARVDLDDLSTLTADIKHRTLIFHSANDRNVPSDASVRLAKARPNLVTLWRLQWRSCA